MSCILGPGCVFCYVFRRYVYELALRAHLVLTLVATVTLWRHLSLQSATASLYTATSCGEGAVQHHGSPRLNTETRMKSN